MNEFKNALFVSFYYFFPYFVYYSSFLSTNFRKLVFEEVVFEDFLLHAKK